MQAYKHGYTESPVITEDTPVSNGLIFQTELELYKEPFNLPSSAFCYGHVHLDMGATCCASFGKEGNGMEIVQSSLLEGKRKYNFRENKKISDALPNHQLAEPIIALRAGDGTGDVTVQVYRLSQPHVKLGDYRFEEEIVYWTWLGPHFLALVTPSNVYHWNLNSPSPCTPEIALKRDGPLAELDVQILGYKCDTDDPSTVTWGLLQAICEGKVRGHIDGHMQLFNFERVQQQWLEGYCGSFGLLKESLADEETLMIAFVQKEVGQSNTRLHVMDLNCGVKATREGAQRKNVEDFTVPLNPNGSLDFLVSLEFSSKDGIIYGVSKHGQVLVFDGISGKLLMTQKLSDEGIFVSGFNNDLNKLVTCNRGGTVQSVTIDSSTFIDFCASSLGSDSEIVKNLALRGGFQQADRENSTRFMDLMEEHDYKSAGRVVAGMRSGALRSEETFDRFTRSSPASMLPLLNSLMAVGPLSESETVLLIKILAQGNKTEQCAEYFAAGNKIQVSNSLAEMLKEGGYLQFATDVFNQQAAFDKYDPIKIKDFLITLNLNDPRTFIVHCDTNDLVDEMITHLFNNNMMKFITAYATKIAPNRLDAVVNTLLHEGADDTVIKKLMDDVDFSATPPEPIIDILDQRDKLALMRGLLESCVQHDNQSTIVHTAYLKTLVMDGMIEDATFQLRSNKFYDQQGLGKYCADRGYSELAYLALTRSIDPSFDQAILQLTVEANLHVRLAQYALRREEPLLWKTILAGGRSQIYDVDIGDGLKEEVINAVIEEVSECKKIDSVTIAVKAFMEAKIDERLIELLERICFHQCSLQDQAMNSATIQNIMMKAAIRVNPRKVNEYVTRLDKYDAGANAQLCINHELYDEAISLFRKAGMVIEALQVEVQYLNDCHRAEEMAMELDDPVAWESLGKTFAELSEKEEDESQKAEHLRRALSALGRSKECDMIHVQKVIRMAKALELYSELVEFVEKVRTMKTAREKSAMLEGELIVAHTKLGSINQAEEVLSKSTNLQTLMKVGEILLAASKGIEGAKPLTAEEAENARKVALMVFERNGSFSKMTSVHLESKDFKEALLSAEKANVPKTWMELCLMALTEGELEIADRAAEHVMNLPDLLENVVKGYEEKDHVNRLITVMENYYDCGPSGKPKFPAGVCPPHVGTHLGLLYIQDAPEKLLEFVSIEGVRNSRINKPRLVSNCEKRGEMKIALTLLIEHLDDQDAAVSFIMRYPANCWEHEIFAKALSQVKNSNLLYSGIIFYLTYLPHLVNKLLLSISERLDLQKLIQTVTKFSLDKDTQESSHETLSPGATKMDLNIERVPQGVRLIFPFLQGIQSVRLPKSRRKLLDELMKKYPLLFMTEDSASNRGDHNAVNTSLNQCYLSLGDVKGLEYSLASTTNYEKNSLAQAVRGSECLSFRRISALLFVKGGSMNEAVQTLLPRKDKDFTFLSDLIAVTKQAKNPKLAQDLVRGLVAKKAMNTVVLCALGAALNDMIPLSMIEEVAWTALSVEESFECSRYLGPIRAEHALRLETKLANLSVSQPSTSNVNGDVNLNIGTTWRAPNKQHALTAGARREGNRQYDVLNQI